MLPQLLANETISIPTKITNLSINRDIEVDEEYKRKDTMDEEVEVDEINFDVERVQSQRCWNYLLNLHKHFGIIMTNI